MTKGTGGFSGILPAFFQSFPAFPPVCTAINPVRLSKNTTGQKTAQTTRIFTRLLMQFTNVTQTACRVLKTKDVNNQKRAS